MDGNIGNPLRESINESMNLLLRPLNDVNDVTWSIILCMVILLAGVLYYVAYILRLAFKEMQEDGQVRKQGQEGSIAIEAESRQRDCEES